MVHNAAAAMPALQRFLNTAVGVFVKLHAVAHNFAHIVGTLVHQHIHRVGVVCLLPGNHCVGKMQIETVVFKAQNCRNAALCQGTVAKRVLFF